jgi:alpha-1,3-mannosyltransferase
MIVTTSSPGAPSGPPIRVLHICRRYRPFTGGMEKYVHDLAVSQMEAGLAVTILTLDRDIAGPTRGLPSREILDGIEVVRLSGWGTPQIAMTFRPDRIWREIFGHDVVHVHDLRFALTSSVLGAMVARRPSIFHTHGLIFHSGSGHPLKRLAIRLYFGPLLKIGGVRTVASSEADRVLLLRDAPYLRSTTFAYPNAVPLRPLLSLARAPIPGRVVSIGRIVSNKALSDLVRALSRIHDTEWSLVLAGEPNSEELARIRDQVDELKIRERVSLVLSFPEEETLRLLESAALAAFPSKGEGFGIALLEAMAAGVPLLANRIPAHQMLLGSELESRLVDFGDPGVAAESIRAALGAPEGELEALSARLRARAADYDVTRLRGQIDRLYALLRVRSHANRRRPIGN